MQETRTVREAARGVLKKGWDLSLPVNPALLAEKLGMSVCDDPSLGEGSCSYLPENKTIFIRKQDSIPHMRYAIARGLAQAVSGKQARTPEMQIEFAQELLMPVVAMRTSVEISNLNVDGLLERFDVPREKLVLRLWQLGYLDD